VNRMSPFVASGGSVIQNLALTSVALFSLFRERKRKAFPAKFETQKIQVLSGKGPVVHQTQGGQEPALGPTTPTCTQRT
jgi:hypothetical protein